MAANLEYQVISKILENQDFHMVEKKKITEDYFFAPEARQIFGTISNHFNAPQTFQSVPSFQLIQQTYPGFQYSASSDTLATLLEQLRLAKMRVELIEVADKITQYADFNPRLGLDSIREAAAELSSRHEETNDLLLSGAFDELWEDYQMVATNKGVTGLPWPWDPLNKATQGIHKGNYYVIYGRPKNMKTWVALYISTLLNMYCNARVLIFSLEMPAKQIVRRIAAIRTCVDYKKLISGELQPHDRDRFFSELYKLKEDAENDLAGGPRVPALLVTSGAGGSGISFLHSKIREFRPDFVLVDGMYLMQDDRQKKRTIDWKAIAHISQDLKRTATEFGIPVMATAQANRKADKNANKADVGDIAYADAIGQDTDFSIFVNKRMDKATKEPEIAMGFPGSREADLDGILINAIPALDFTLKSEFIVSEGDSNQNSKGPGGPGNGVNHSTAPNLPIRSWRGG